MGYVRGVGGVHGSRTVCPDLSKRCSRVILAVYRLIALQRRVAGARESPSGAGRTHVVAKQ